MRRVRPALPGLRRTARRIRSETTQNGRKGRYNLPARDVSYVSRPSQAPVLPLPVPMYMSVRLSRPSAARVLPWVYLVLLWAAASSAVALGAHAAAAVLGNSF